MKNQPVELFGKETIGFNDTEIIISTKEYTDFSKLEAKSREEKPAKIDFVNFEKVTVIPFEKITEISYVEDTYDAQVVYTDEENETKKQNLQFVKMQERGELAYQIAQLKNFERSKIKEANSESFIMYLGAALLAVILVGGSVYFNLSPSAKGIKAGKTHFLVEIFQRLATLAGIPITVGVGVIVVAVFLYLAFQHTTETKEKVVYK